MCYCLPMLENLLIILPTNALFRYIQDSLSSIPGIDSSEIEDFIRIFLPVAFFLLDFLVPAILMTFIRTPFESAKHRQ